MKVSRFLPNIPLPLSNRPGMGTQLVQMLNFASVSNPMTIITGTKDESSYHGCNLDEDEAALRAISLLHSKVAV